MDNLASLDRSPEDKLGRPLRDLRISVMDRCNFRCPYCMPRERFHEHYAFLKTAERLSFEEILRLAPACSCPWACASCASPAGNRCCA